MAEPAQNYLYNGKEQMEGTGLYAYGFRYYDPVIGRFTGVDPMANKFAAHGSYNYVLNNPLGLVDPDGRAACPPGVDCDNPLPNMSRIRVNRASNLGPGYTRSQGARYHSGHDLYAASGTDVRSVMDGVVHASGNSSSYGNYVTVVHNICETCTDTDANGNTTTTEINKTYYSFYAHLTAVNVSKGDAIPVGANLGTVGTTGNANGLAGQNVHLHYELGTKLRSTSSDFLDKDGLVDPNLAYKNVSFSSADPSAVQNRTSVLRTRTNRNGRPIEVLKQNFNNTTERGADQLLYGRASRHRGRGGEN